MLRIFDITTENGIQEDYMNLNADNKRAHVSRLTLGTTVIYIYITKHFGHNRCLFSRRPPILAPNTMAYLHHWDKANFSSLTVFLLRAELLLPQMSYLCIASSWFQLQD